ncbi:hypothetical protein ES703_77025 [subsurface metagenome]
MRFNAISRNGNGFSSINTLPNRKYLITHSTMQGLPPAIFCCLNANCTVEDSVLGNNVTVASGCKLEPGSRIWPGASLA